MPTTVISPTVRDLPKRIAAVSSRDVDLDVLLEEIDDHARRIDERCVASGGEHGWDDDELEQAVLDGCSAVVDDRDAGMVSEVVRHRRELHDDATLQKVKERIREQHAARELDAELPQSDDERERPRL